MLPSAPERSACPMKLHSFAPSSLVLLLSVASAPAAVLSNPAITSTSSESSSALAVSALALRRRSG